MNSRSFESKGELELNPEVQIQQLVDVFRAKKVFDRHYEKQHMSPHIEVLEDENEERMDEEGILKESQKGISLREGLTDKLPTLHDLGLTFDLSRISNITMSRDLETTKNSDDIDALIEKSAYGERESPNVQYDLTDANKFISFLNSLRPENLQDKIGGGRLVIREGLAAILDSLSSQLKDRYDLNNPDDRVIELLGHGKEIIEQYKRLGLDWDHPNSIKQLESYIQHIRQGDFKEFLAISDASGLNKGETWVAPYNIHEFIKPEDYSNYWEKLIGLLRDSLRNENALPTVTNAVTVQIGNLHRAIPDIEKTLDRLNGSLKTESETWRKESIEKVKEENIRYLTTAKESLIELEKLNSQI